MYIKLQIFLQHGTFKILEQKDTPAREILCDIHGPDICYFNGNNITLYIRGDDHSRDFTVLDYQNLNSTGNNCISGYYMELTLSLHPLLKRQ